MFTTALFISSSAIKTLLGNFVGQPSGITLLILYGFLGLSFFFNGIDREQFLRFCTPIVILWALIAWTWIVYPERHTFYRTSLYNLFDASYPIYGVYITSVCLLDNSTEHILKSLKVAALIMAICYSYQALDVIQNGVWTRGSIYNGVSVIIKSNYNLNWGYNVYVICVILFAFYLLEGKTSYLLFTGIGLAGIFMYGSRGPIIMFIANILLSVLLYKKDSLSRRMIVIILIGIVALIFLSSGIIQNAILLLVAKRGISSRTLQKLMSGSIADLSGREAVYPLVLERIAKSPIIGWGIYGDRFFLNMVVQGGSAYSHNVILELCISFGIFGFLFFAWIVSKSIAFFQDHSDMADRILLIICIGSCLSLMLSLTFWQQPMFWVLLAVLIGNKDHSYEYDAE